MQGEVPRADDPHYTQRAAIHTAFLAGHIGFDDAPVDPRGEGCRLQGNRPRRAPFQLRLEPGAAGLANDPVDDFFTAPVEHRHHLMQHRRSRCRAQRGPLWLDPRRFAVRSIEVITVGLGNVQQHGIIERVSHAQGFTGSAGSPLTGNWLQVKFTVTRAGIRHEALLGQGNSNSGFTDGFRLTSLLWRSHLNADNG
ncbi:hypothetical protein D3C77_352740 [compost metagenome]